MTKDFQRVGRYLHQASFFMNDASFSRRDSVGSLVDWSMITSKNPVFHIRLRGCRLVGLREKPRKFPSSSDNLFLCSSLNSGDIINEQFICDSKFLAGHPSNPRCIGNNT
ncbi:hypothetical protein TNCV_5056541 [Trichonephila clavipes]|nr:hypothetical protein TNCV_5056541 [Trichonephila clavipes]